MTWNKKKGVKPANKLDEFAMNQDKFYSEDKDLKKTHEANYVLQQQARERITAPDASLGEKLAAVGTYAVMKAKQHFGLGLPI